MNIEKLKLRMLAEGYEITDATEQANAIGFNNEDHNISFAVDETEAILVTLHKPIVGTINRINARQVITNRFADLLNELDAK